MGTFSVQLRKRGAVNFSDIIHLETSWLNVINKPATFTPTAHNHGPGDLTPGSNGQIIKTVNGVPVWANDEVGEPFVGGTLTAKLTLMNSFPNNQGVLNIPNIGSVNPSASIAGDVWMRSNLLYFNGGGSIRQLAHTGSWSALSEAEMEAGTLTTSRFITALRLKQAVEYHAPVKNDDARLTDARPASDVYAWAKASTKPTYTAAEVNALASNHAASGVTTAKITNWDNAFTIANNLDFSSHVGDPYIIGFDGVENKFVPVDPATYLPASDPIPHDILTTTNSLATLPADVPHNRIYRMTSSFARTVALPSNTTSAIPIGTAVYFQRAAAGTVTFSAGSGATLVSANNANAIANTNGIAAAIKVLANTWLLVGDIE